MTARPCFLINAGFDRACALSLAFTLWAAALTPSRAWSKPPAPAQEAGAVVEADEADASPAPRRESDARSEDEAEAPRRSRELSAERGSRQRASVVDAPSPFVPRLKAPGEGLMMDPARQALGVAMLGGGGIAASVGLLMLRSNAPDDCSRSGCREQSRARLNLGAGLLIGGVFAGGVGLYILVSERRNAGPRIITTTPLRAHRDAPDATRWQVGLEPAPGGAVLQSRIDF